MSDKQTAIVKSTESKFTEYIPFGAQDKIKLSVEMVKSLIAVKTKSGKTCSDTDAIKFIAMCSARRLNPFEGDSFLIGYDGKDGPTFSLITAHQAFLKRAELHPEYNGMRSGVIVKRDENILDLEGDFYLEGDEVLGGWATVHFKNREHSMHKRVRLQRFKKSWGLWMEDPAGMVVKCAEADALRSSFPTMLGGLYLKEESDLPRNERITKPVFSTPDPHGLQAPSPAIEVQTELPKEQEPPLNQVKALCAAEKITEGILVEFLQAVGLAEDDDLEMSDLEDQTLMMVIEQWPDFSARIKEAGK